MKQGRLHIRVHKQATLWPEGSKSNGLPRGSQKKEERKNRTTDEPEVAESERKPRCSTNNMDSQTDGYNEEEDHPARLGVP